MKYNLIYLQDLLQATSLADRLQAKQLLPAPIAEPGRNLVGQIRAGRSVSQGRRRVALSVLQTQLAAPRRRPASL